LLRRRHYQPPLILLAITPIATGLPTLIAIIFIDYAIRRDWPLPLRHIGHYAS
jgi:hypothetical protein